MKQLVNSLEECLSHITQRQDDKMIFNDQSDTIIQIFGNRNRLRNEHQQTYKILYEGRPAAYYWGRLEEEMTHNQDNIALGDIQRELQQFTECDDVRDIISLGTGIGLQDRRFVRYISNKNRLNRNYIPMDLNYYFLVNSSEEVDQSNYMSGCQIASRYAVLGDFEK